jgi:hypothetical protein
MAVPDEVAVALQEAVVEERTLVETFPEETAQEAIDAATIMAAVGAINVTTLLEIHTEEVIEVAMVVTVVDMTIDVVAVDTRTEDAIKKPAGRPLKWTG